MTEVNGIGANSKPMIEIKTQNGTFKVSENLYESFNPAVSGLGSKLSLKNGVSVFMPEARNGSITIKDTGNIQILADGTSAIVDAKNGANDDLYIEASNSSDVYISHDEEDDVTTRTLGGHSSSIRNGGALKYLTHKVREKAEAQAKTEAKADADAKAKADSAKAKAEAEAVKKSASNNAAVQYLKDFVEEHNSALALEEKAPIPDDVPTPTPDESFLNEPWNFVL